VSKGIHLFPSKFFNFSQGFLFSLPRSLPSQLFLWDPPSLKARASRYPLQRCAVEIPPEGDFSSMLFGSLNLPFVPHLSFPIVVLFVEKILQIMADQFFTFLVSPEVLLSSPLSFPIGRDSIFSRGLFFQFHRGSPNDAFQKFRASDEWGLESLMLLRRLIASLPFN